MFGKVFFFFLIRCTFGKAVLPLRLKSTVLINDAHKKKNIKGDGEKAFLFGIAGKGGNESQSFVKRRWGWWI